MVDAASVVLMMCMIIGHIYLGTIGMRGAFKAAMKTDIDETWAREALYCEHDDIMAGKISFPPSAPPINPAKRPTRPAGADKLRPGEHHEKDLIIAWPAAPA